jgi:hypothetical protein
MTCRSRSSRSGVAFFASLALFPAAVCAAELPAIKVSETNQVAACATPGRLMSYLRQRNPKLNPAFDSVASEYMRHGEELKVRWDFAFFQMLLETGYLTYTGDVKPDQNNFAGLGATGGGVRGERFKDVSSGARAHIEHLVMYSGQRVENPVAERTRNIQEWGVLTSWQKGITGPITFAQLAKQWAPTSKRYAADIAAIADRFFDGPCKDEDPQPELVAEIRGTPVKTAAVEQPSKTRGLDAQKRPAEDVAKVSTAKESPAAKDSAAKDTASARTAHGSMSEEEKFQNKGAAAVAAVAKEGKAEPKKTSTSPPLTLLNASASEEAAPAKLDGVQEAPAAQKADVPAAAASKADAAKAIEVAALPGAIKDAGKVEKAAPSAKPDKSDKAEKKAAPSAGAGSGKCRVWTASYGGSKAIIIKAVQDKTVNYTVLDVNDGSEKREADAYINAYAKGGQSVGEFSNQSQALEKAFELCPEG